MTSRYRSPSPTNGTPGDLPRIHERYTFYLVPLFIIALVASMGPVRSQALVRTGLAASAVVAFLPLLIEYGRYVNNSIIADTFSLEPVAKATAGLITPVSHAGLALAIISAGLGAAYTLARTRPVVIAVVLVLLLAFISATVQNRLISAGKAGAPTQSVPPNWIDAAAPGGHVAYLEAPGDVGPISPTVFDNLGIDRLYYRCVPNYTADFGERRVTLDSYGRLRVAKALVRAPYLVVGSSAGVLGTVIARDPQVRLVVVRPASGTIRVAAKARSLWRCRARNESRS